MSNTGAAVVDFGAGIGSNTAITTVTGQAGILAGSNVEAFMMAEATAEHNAYEHTVVPIKLTCGNIVPGTGFDIYGTTDWRLTRSFNVRWVWV